MLNNYHPIFKFLLAPAHYCHFHNAYHNSVMHCGELHNTYAEQLGPIV